MDKIKVFDGCFNPIKYIKNDDIFIVLTPEEKNVLMVTREKFNEVVPDTANENNKLTDKLYVDGIKTELDTDIAVINSKIPSTASDTNKLIDKLYVDELVAAEQSRAKNTEDLLDRSIDHEVERATTKETLLENAITIINSKIPSTATDTNKLVDEDFVDSTIDDINDSIDIIDEVTAESLYNLNERKQDIIEDLDDIRSGAALSKTAYQKPLNGIPASDIASGVIPDVSQFVTKSVNDLVNYYKKSETYTQSEVNALIGSIQQFHYEIYALLQNITTPATNVLYLIGPTGSGSDKYEEYVYANNTFVKIGDTSINLNGYVTTQALNTALDNYVTSSELATAIIAKQDKIDSSNKLNADLVDDTNTTHKFITTAERTLWNTVTDKAPLPFVVTCGIDPSDVPFVNSTLDEIWTARQNGKNIRVNFTKAGGVAFKDDATLLLDGSRNCVVHTVHNGTHYTVTIYDDNGTTKLSYAETHDSDKQDVISDLSTIRSGAAAGATAYQKPQSGIPASDIAAGVIPDVSNFITRSVDNLVNYYLKSETYTRQEVRDLIGAINQFHFEIYPSLADVTAPASNVLYLIGPSGSGTDLYEEYVYPNSTQGFTKIGDTSIDLSNYVTTQALNTALANYVTSTYLTTLLSAKQDTLDSGTNIKSINDESILGAGNVNFAKYEDTLINTEAIICDEPDAIDGISLYVNTSGCTVKPNQKIVFNDTAGTNTLYLIDITDINNRTIIKSGQSSIEWNNLGNTDVLILLASSSDSVQTLSASRYWRGTDNVFIAKYGVTTVQEIDNAITAGNVVICHYNGKTYNLYYYDTNDAIIYFYSFYDKYQYNIRLVRATNTWEHGTNAYEMTGNKAEDFTTLNNTKYPTTKAVADYVQPKIVTITFRQF